MKGAAKLVKRFLQISNIDIQLARQAEKCKIIDRHRWLNLAAGMAKVRRPHVPAGPARRVRAAGNRRRVQGINCHKTHSPRMPHRRAGAKSRLGAAEGGAVVE